MEKTKTKTNLSDQRRKLDIKAGDTVRVWSKIQEKGKTRLQAFEGIVLARKHGAESGATFTVRKIASGVGVERIFPLYSPNIDKIELVKRAKVRRSKLYYLREKAAKEIKKKMRNLIPFLAQPQEEEIEEESEPVEEEVIEKEENLQKNEEQKEENQSEQKETEKPKEEKQSTN